MTTPDSFYYTNQYESKQFRFYIQFHFVTINSRHFKRRLGTEHIKMYLRLTPRLQRF